MAYTILNQKYVNSGLNRIPNWADPCTRCNPYRTGPCGKCRSYWSGQGPCGAWGGTELCLDCSQPCGTIPPNGIDPDCPVSPIPAGGFSRAAPSMCCNKLKGEKGGRGCCGGKGGCDGRGSCGGRGGGCCGGKGGCDGRGSCGGGRGSCGGRGSYGDRGPTYNGCGDPNVEIKIGQPAGSICDPLLPPVIYPTDPCLHPWITNLNWIQRTYGGRLNGCGEMHHMDLF